ncbi:putative glycosyl transferase, family 31 [Lupinus albus]|uniref:Putative glycosyl transferase, family 31 n=1 Tax=Lupinus albus TaxID=3870 RepID=A0A6A4PHR1_LUPAL|nr:putative glycosyl transferase, family 31 [Lupinus albus]
MIFISKFNYFCCFSCYTLRECIDCRTLDNTTSNLELKLVAARVVYESIQNDSPVPKDISKNESFSKRNYLMVVGINIVFNNYNVYNLIILLLLFMFIFLFWVEMLIILITTQIGDNTLIFL